MLAALATLTSNKAPTVSISGGNRTISDSDGASGERVAFSASSTDSDGTISSNEWLLLGNVVAVGPVASIYLPDGVSTVTFRATDDDGASSSTSVIITVSAPAPNNAPSVAISGGSYTVADSDSAVGETVNFSATASDNDGSIATTEWLINGAVVASGLNVAIALAGGTTQVSFRATDNDGATSSTSVSITVEAPSSGLPAYNRDDYLTSWLDSDGDCIDTRDEVLILETTIAVTMDSAGCNVLSGLWLDPYTAQTFTNPSDLDIDHLVPLSEAHDSGAAYWTSDQKHAFANDLVTAHALIAVENSANRSKGARDPAEWLPTNLAYRCEYVRNWVDVKSKYGLEMDAQEQAAIESILGGSVSSATRAKVTGITAAGGGSTATFALGLRKNNDCGYSTSATTQDTVEITFSITPEEPHLRAQFGVMLVANLGGSLFMIDSGGQLLPFSGDPSQLVGFINSRTLNESFDFTLFEGRFADPVTVDIYVAYSTAQGDFVYTPVPLGLMITSP